MITSIAKFAGSVSTSKTSWRKPMAAASTSIFSGARRRSAITRQSPRVAGITPMDGSLWPSASTVETRPIPEMPSRTRAQKPSTQVGCLRRKS